MKMVFEIQNYKFNPTRETFEEIIIGQTNSQIELLTQNKKNNKGETQMETNNTTQQNNNKQELSNWLELEEKQLKTPLSFEKKPALKLENNKLTSFEIDFGKPFETWNTEANGKKVVKAIIPVKHDGVDKILWMNKSNPVYSDIVRAGRAGQRVFKIFTTGTQAQTKYALVKD